MAKHSAPEIVVSGLGAICSIGSHVEAIWSGLLKGRCGVRPTKSFSTEGFLHHNACEVEGLDHYLDPEHRFPGRATNLLMVAVEDALFDANIGMDLLSHGRVGICVGTTMGETWELDSNLGTYPAPYRAGFDTIAVNIADHYRIKGPIWTFTNACAAGNYAIACAMEELRQNRADVMLVGGVDSFSRTAFMGFHSLRALAPDVSRPFDANRKGLILGEGAGVLMLETLEHLEQRKGRARARLLGYGLTGDAHHITQPEMSGTEAIRAMQKALDMADIDREQIGYVSAHGTGTPANDSMEMQSLYTMFGRNIPTSSIKGHIGHTLGAASAIEAVVSVKALETGALPHTLHLEQVDSSCRVDAIHGEPRSKAVEYVLSNAYAFGGVNTSVLFGKV